MRKVSRVIDRQGKPSSFAQITKRRKRLAGNAPGMMLRAIIGNRWLIGPYKSTPSWSNEISLKKKESEILLIRHRPRLARSAHDRSIRLVDKRARLSIRVNFRKCPHRGTTNPTLTEQWLRRCRLFDPRRGSVYSGTSPGIFIDILLFIVVHT